MRTVALLGLGFRLLIVALLTLFWGVPVILLSFFDPHAERAALLIRFWARGVLWTCGVKVQVRGRERLDPQQPYIFMANHQSNFDIPILMSAFDTLQVRWVSKREVRKVPIIGLCMQRTQQVLVDRESPAQALAVIRQVKALLAAGISVAFFPEGTRTRDGRLQAFKPGGFAVAVEAGVPVTPVIVRGSRALWPPGGLDIRPGEVEVVFSDPIRLEDHLPKKLARETLALRVREAIAAQLPESLMTPSEASVVIPPHSSSSVSEQSSS